MPFDLNKPDSATFFINLSEVGQLDKTSFCNASQNYNSPIVENSKDYFVSIERATIPLQSIKLFKDIPEAFTFVKKADDTTVTKSLIDVFTIVDFLQQINNFADTEGNKVKFYLQNSGRVKIVYENFTNYRLLLSNELRAIFDLGSSTLDALVNIADFLTPSSIIDRVDTLRRIILVSRNLPCVSEMNNQTKLREITSIDYAPDSTFSFSGGNGKVVDDDWTFSNVSARGNLVLAPQYSRLLTMNGAEITNINVEAYAEILDLLTLKIKLTRISLRPASEFQIKLQFWRRS